MGLLGNIFYTTGKASATRPWTSIFIGLVITMIGSIGFINFRSTVSTLSHIFLAARHLNNLYVMSSLSFLLSG